MVFLVNAVAISLSILANVVTAIVQRRYSLKSKAPASFPPAVSYLLGVSPLGIVVGLLLAHHIHWSWFIVLLFVSNSSIIAVANWLLFKAVKRLPVMQFQMINQFYEIVVIVLGWTFLKEGLGLFQVLGAMLLFVAAILAIKAPAKNLDGSRRKVHLQSVLLTLAGATLGGTSLVIEKAALGHMDIGAYLIFGYSAQTLAMLVLASKDATKATLQQFRAEEITWAACMGLANGTAGVLYVVAIVHANNISLVTAVTAIALPLTAFAACAILKERENQRLLWVGLIIGFLGLLISALH